MLSKIKSHLCVYLKPLGLSPPEKTNIYKQCERANATLSVYILIYYLRMLLLLNLTKQYLNAKFP